MQDYQVRSFIKQIEAHIDLLSLPLSDPDCIALESRKALYLDITIAINDLYDRSAIDFITRVLLSELASHAYICGGL